MKEQELSIPADGYGFSRREYGEGFQETVGEMEYDTEYIAKLVEAHPPRDWEEELKEDFPRNAFNLVLVKRGRTYGNSCPCSNCHGDCL